MPKGVKDSPPGVRPIGARALKSAIDTLRPYLAEARVLDLYAGQGRLGLSACEEGAHSVLVEMNPSLCREIRTQLAKYSFPGEVVQSEVFKYLKQAADQAIQFDVIFADPPFPDWSPSFESSLFSAVAQVTAQDAIFLVKYPSRMLASRALPAFTAWKSTQFGESELRYFRAMKS